MKTTAYATSTAQADVDTGHRLQFPGCPASTVTVADVQRWLDQLPPLYRNPLESTSSEAIAAWLFSRSLRLVEQGLQSLDNRNWLAARELCAAADTLLKPENTHATVQDTRYGCAPKPPRERAARLFATLAQARIGLLAMSDGFSRTGVSIALDDAELLARDVLDNPIPDDVRAALDRMCTPLDESVLKGATATADAHSMRVIRAHILGSENGTPPCQSPAA